MTLNVCSGRHCSPMFRCRRLLVHSFYSILGACCCMFRPTLQYKDLSIACRRIAAVGRREALCSASVVACLGRRSSVRPRAWVCCLLRTDFEHCWRRHGRAGSLFLLTGDCSCNLLWMDIMLAQRRVQLWGTPHGMMNDIGRCKRLS